MIISDDEIQIICERNPEPWYDDRDFARAIEAKVLEKLSDKLRDADRYAWLREQHWSDDTLTVTKPDCVKLGSLTYSLGMLDQAIDAAIKESDY